MAEESAPGGVELVETELFVEAIYRQFGVDFRGFDKELLLRKFDALKDRYELDSISSLQGRVLREGPLAREALRFVSESDGSLLAQANTFTALRCAVLPVLRSSSWPVVWLAECDDPGLIVQLLVMLEEEGLLGKTQLFVTNANEDVLLDVARLRLGPEDAARSSAAHIKGGGHHALLDYGVSGADGFFLRPELASNIVWGQFDLASDASLKEFHAIVCQRPLLDFGQPLQRRALSLFAASLCNFGILQVEAPGGVLSSDLARDFTVVLSEQGIYKRNPSVAN